MKRFFLALLVALVPPALAEERAIVKEVVVKAAPDAAWRAWTTAEGIRSFFAPDALVDPRPDGPFQIYMNPYAPPGLKGADDMRFLALQEGRLVSFTWNAPPQFPEARRQRTVVTVRFSEAGEGHTKVVLRHAGWGDGGEWDKTYEYFDRAWGRVLANLKKRFDDGPLDWTPYRAQMQAAVAAGKVKEGVPIPQSQAPRVLRIETIVPAPPAEVWKAFSTVEGLKRWVAPVIALDLRTGGTMLTHYDAKASIGSAGTIRLGIVNVIEGELVTYKVNLTPRFPEAVRFADQDLQEIVQLSASGDGRTRVVSTMLGFGGGKEWDETYAFFEKGNAWHYRKLVEAFGGPPAK